MKTIVESLKDLAAKLGAEEKNVQTIPEAIDGITEAVSGGSAEVKWVTVYDGTVSVVYDYETDEEFKFGNVDVTNGNVFSNAEKVKFTYDGETYESGRTYDRTETSSGLRYVYYGAPWVDRNNYDFSEFPASLRIGMSNIKEEFRIGVATKLIDGDDMHTLKIEVAVTEEGGGDSGGGEALPMVTITVTYGAQTVATCDKTYQELLQILGDFTMKPIMVCQNITNANRKLIYVGELSTTNGGTSELSIIFHEHIIVDKKFNGITRCTCVIDASDACTFMREDMTLKS